MNLQHVPDQFVSDFIKIISLKRILKIEEYCVVACSLYIGISQLKATIR